MARDAVQELIVRIKQEGLGNLEFLKKELKQVSSQSKISEGSINKLQKEISKFGAATKNSVNGLKGQIAAFEKLRAQTGFQGKAYKSLTNDIIQLNRELERRLGIEKELDKGGGRASRTPSGKGDAGLLSSRYDKSSTGGSEQFAQRQAALSALLVTRTFENITDGQRNFLETFQKTAKGTFDVSRIKESTREFRKIINESNAAFLKSSQYGPGGVMTLQGEHKFDAAELVNKGKLNDVQKAALNVTDELAITSQRYLEVLTKINAETVAQSTLLGSRDAEAANKGALARANIITSTDAVARQDKQVRSYLSYGVQSPDYRQTSVRKGGTYFNPDFIGPAEKEFSKKNPFAQYLQNMFGMLGPDWQSDTYKAMLAEKAKQGPYSVDVVKDRIDLKSRMSGSYSPFIGPLQERDRVNVIQKGLNQKVAKVVDPLGLGQSPKYPKTEFGLGEELRNLKRDLPNLENGTKPWLALVDKVAKKNKEINELIKKGNEAIKERKKEIAESVNPKVNQKLLPAAGQTSGKATVQDLQRRAQERLAASYTPAQFTAEQYGPQLETQDQLITRLQKTIKVRTNSIKTISEHRNKLEEIRKTLAPTSAKFKSVAKSIEQADKSLGKLNKTSKGFGKKGLLGFGQSVLGGAYFGGPFGGIGAGIGQMFGGQQGAATGGLVGAQIGRPITEFIGGSTSYAAGISKAELTLEQITKDAGSYGVAMEAVKTAVEDYNVPQEVAIKGMTRLSAAVLGSGGNINNAAEAFLNTTAAIKGTAGSADDVKSAITAMVQIYSKGKVSAEELSGQLGERFPGAVTKFAEANDISTQSLQKALKNGTVGLDMLSKFIESLGTEYAGLAKKISGSPEEAGARARIAMNKLRIAVGDELIPIGKEFQEISANILIDLVPALTKVAEIGGNVFFGFSQVVKVLADNFNILAPAITTATVAFVAYNLQLQIANRTGIILMFRNLLALLIRIRRTIVLATVSMEAFNIAMKKNKWALIATAIATVGSSIWAILDAQKALNEEEGILGDITGMNLEETEAKLETVKGKIKELQAQIADKDTTIPERRGLNKLITQYKDGMLELQTQITKLGGKVVFDPLAEGAEDAGEKIYKGLSGGVNKFMDDMKNAGAEFANVTASWFDRMASTLADFVMTGKLKFKEFARSVIADLAKMIMKQMIFNILAGLDVGNWGKFRLGPNSAMNRSPDLPMPKGANGLVVAKNGIVPYAKGGIVDSPTLFPFAKGVGLMGEAGPESIMPLKRGGDGKLGVIAHGGGSTVVNVSVDAKGTKASGDGMQAKQLGKLVGIAVEAELIKQKRPGGILYS